MQRRLRSYPTAISNIIPRTLLQLNQPPPSRLRVRHILRNPRHADHIRNLLHLIVQSRRQLPRLDIAVRVHFLRPRRDQENRNLARIENLRGHDIHVSDVEDAPVGFEARLRVLLHQRRPDLVLRRAQPQLQRLSVALHERIQNLWQNILSQLLQEGLELERGVHFAELLDDHCGLVFSEEAGYAVGDAARCGY